MIVYRNMVRLVHDGAPKFLLDLNYIVELLVPLDDSSDEANLPIEDLVVCLVLACAIEAWHGPHQLLVLASHCKGLARMQVRGFTQGVVDHGKADDWGLVGPNAIASNAVVVQSSLKSFHQ